MGICGKDKDTNNTSLNSAQGMISILSTCSTPAAVASLGSTFGIAFTAIGIGKCSEKLLEWELQVDVKTKIQGFGGTTLLISLGQC